MEPFHFHLFVCTQQKPEGSQACSATGSLTVLDRFDHEIRARGLAHDVQLTACGCLGLCDEGPIVVVYPAGIWYRRVQPSDVPEIVAMHLARGKPVERLVWNDSEAMKALAVEHGEKFREAVEARDKAGVLPDRLQQMTRDLMSSRCLLTALELDIFTAVGAGADIEQIGNRIHASARGVGMLLNALVALGVLYKTGEEYRNTPESARFFVQGSKDNQRDGLMHTVDLWHRWSTLTETVRIGHRVPSAGSKTAEWTQHFIAGMQRNARERATLVVKALGTDGVRRILDLGGGSGAYSIAFAQASPDVHCEILDLPEVVPLTQEYVDKAGVSAQVRPHAGDMLRDDFGSNYDLIMLNAICHMFSEQQNREIFRRARRALSPGGRLAVQDFILNADKTGPQQAALFSLNMLVGTEAGASYSEAEYTDWMNEAGYQHVTRLNLPGPSDLILAS